LASLLLLFSPLFSEKNELYFTMLKKSIACLYRKKISFAKGPPNMFVPAQKTFVLFLLVSSLLLCACASRQTRSENDPDLSCFEVEEEIRFGNYVDAIVANYYPTFGLMAGDEVTFKVRSFGTQHGREVWDFGDGSAPVKVQSDGNADQHNPAGYAMTKHRYEKPGDYIVTVRRSDENGYEAVGHLHVRVD